MLGIANMTEISRHYTHSIYTDSHRFFTAFAPDDLVRRCGGQFQVIRGLEHVLEHRMAACLNNLRTLAELRRTSSAGNTLPDYVEIHEEGGVLCGESRYYSYEVLQTEDDMRFCRKLAAVCDWMKQLIAELGKEPVAEWDDIIFEKGEYRGTARAAFGCGFVGKIAPLFPAQEFGGPAVFRQSAENLRSYLRIGIRCCSEPSPQVFCAGVSADSGTCTGSQQCAAVGNALCHSSCTMRSAGIRSGLFSPAVCAKADGIVSDCRGDQTGISVRQSCGVSLR